MRAESVFALSSNSKVSLISALHYLFCAVTTLKASAMAARISTRSAHALRAQLRSTTKTYTSCSRLPSAAPLTSGSCLTSQVKSNLHFSRSTAAPFSTTAKMGRTETDAFGPLEVEDSRYWGAQTQRSLGNFKINQPQDRMPEGVVRAFGILKGAAAKVNMKFGLGM